MGKKNSKGGNSNILGGENMLCEKRSKKRGCLIIRRPTSSLQLYVAIYESRIKRKSARGSDLTDLEDAMGHLHRRQRLKDIFESKFWSDLMELCK